MRCPPCGVAGIDLVSERIPGETTILAFRHLLEKHNLGEQTFAAAVTARIDDAPAADQAFMTNVAGSMAFSGSGGLIQTTSG